MQENPRPVWRNIWGWIGGLTILWGVWFCGNVQAQQPQPGPTPDVAALQCQQQLTAVRQDLKISEQTVDEVHLPTMKQSAKALVILNNQLQEAKQRVQQLEQENARLMKQGTSPTTMPAAEPVAKPEG